jgi:hypothetical protein
MDRPGVDFAVYTTNTEEINPFSQTRFKPGIAGSEQTQIHKLDRVATTISALIMHLYTNFDKLCEK